MTAAVTPESPWYLWKLHRLVLKNWPGWRRILLPSGQVLPARYMAEGKINYVFRLRGESRLLRITRRQYYDPAHVVDEQSTVANCRFMNSLAEMNLSVHAVHLCGGACLVDDGGAALSKLGRTLGREAFWEVFSGLRRWSVETGVVILDFNENNWRVRDAVIRLVDVDTDFTCPLSQVRKNPLVTRRIDVSEHESDEAALSAFLAKEEDLLWRGSHSGGHHDACLPAVREEKTTKYAKGAKMGTD